MEVLAFPSWSLPWRPLTSLPTDRLVLARLEHFARMKPMRLVFARATEFGPVLSDGSEISDVWNLTGWLEQDVEIELHTSAAAAAEPKSLEWEASADGSEIALDGLGGHYVISQRKGRSRLEYEIDLSRCLDQRHSDNLRALAQEDFDARIRGSLGTHQ